MRLNRLNARADVRARVVMGSAGMRGRPERRHQRRHPAARRTASTTPRATCAGAHARRALGSELERQLDDARDETIYLEVKLRKNETGRRAASTSSCATAIDDIRSQRARARSPRGPTVSDSDRRPNRVASTEDADVPVGTELDVRLQQPAQLGDGAGRGSLRSDHDGRSATSGDRVLIPAGSVMRGVVSSVNKAGRLERKGKPDAGVRSGHGRTAATIRFAPP